MQESRNLKSALSSLPLSATRASPEDGWDKTVFSHGTMSLLVFTPRGRDFQPPHTASGIGSAQRDLEFPFLSEDYFVPPYASISISHGTQTVRPSTLVAG